ncbi:MAG: UDP-N-acetylmuramoyl-L-alanine--D-glutamate ligase [Alphaproteobacteria bacterium]|nr:UDP-N-acetylmuramoyl-L-alanine--D-glutamate ligase [Alphaproteobacteria bacterium]
MIDVRPFVEECGNKPVAVFGLGRSGLSTVRALRAAHARVLAWDDKPDSRERAQEAGAEIIPLDGNILKECACLVLAPGISLHYPHPHPVVMAARAAGIEILGDIEILHRSRTGRPVIGITGTNGKSTTTALLAHVLKCCGKSVSCGGNIGRPVLDLPLPAEDGVFVLELSSYQIDLCPSFTPDIGILLNITPDHIDRHGSMENYIAAKARIFSDQSTAIISGDDTPCRAIIADLGGSLDSLSSGLSPSVTFQVIQGAKNKRSGETPLTAVLVQENKLYEAHGAAVSPVGSLESMRIKGLHNRQNAAASYAAARQCGIASAEILSALASFPGLPHRQFPVRAIGPVTYINDSKATNAEAAGKALGSFPAIHWIVGGRPKEGGLQGLESLMGRVRHAYVIGEAAAEFSVWLEKNNVPFTPCGTLDRAVLAAHRGAQEESGPSVVLLAPACASFDQFSSFEERGDIFTDLVCGLPES